MSQEQSNGSFQTALTLAAAALALGLGGIWIGNVQFISNVDQNVHPVFVMRLASLLLYGVFLAIAILIHRNRRSSDQSSSANAVALGKEKRIMSVLMTVGLVLYLGAFALNAFTPYAVAALVLSKFIGAPLTIATVLLFGRLPRTRTSHWIMMGSLGGFIISALFISATNLLSLGSSAVILVALVLIAISVGYVRLGYSTLINASGDNSQNDLKQYSKNELPVSQAVTPLFAVALVIVSLMLGYSQGSFSSIATANGIPVAIGLVLAAIVLRLIFKDVNTPFFFLTGLVCVAVAALFGTMYAQWANTAGDIVATLASAMFESVVYILSSWAVFRSNAKIIAATFARFLVVLGHFGGTLFSSAEFFLINQGIQDQSASAITVLGLYLLLLVIIYRVPPLQAMLLGNTSEAEANQFIPTPIVITHELNTEEEQGTGDNRAKKDIPVQQAETEKRHSLETMYREQWDTACAEVAKKYKLTPRETQVLGYLSRGRNVVFIQKEMILSNNTVKMHVRHIYTKLGVHSQQDVISIVQTIAEEQ